MRSKPSHRPLHQLSEDRSTAVERSNPSGLWLLCSSRRGFRRSSNLDDPPPCCHHEWSSLKYEKLHFKLFFLSTDKVTPLSAHFNFGWSKFITTLRENWQWMFPRAHSIFAGSAGKLQSTFLHRFLGAWRVKTFSETLVPLMQKID